MKTKTYKKFGLFTAISMVLGSVAGIGIFFKNISIFKVAGGNPAVILLSWIIAGLIALGAALSFAEVGSGVSSKSGVSKYIAVLVNKKLGQLCKIIETVFYRGIVIFAITCFTSESIIQIFLDGKSLDKNIHMGYVILLATGIYLFFWTMIIVSQNFIGIFQNVSVILKFVPLLLIIFIGLIGPFDSHTDSAFTAKKWHKQSIDIHKKLSISSFSLSALIMLLPSALFSFDGFIYVSNIADDIKKPKKNIPLAMVLGMTGVLVIYVLIALSQILVGRSTSADVIKILANHNPKTEIILTRFLYIFLAIAALGVCNGFIFSQTRMTQATFEEGLIIGYKKLFSKFKKNGAFVLTLCIYFMWTIIIGIPSIVLNTDAIIDVFSNYPILFFFIIYIIVIIAQLKNRNKNKIVFSKKNKFFFKLEKNTPKLKTQHINNWIFLPMVLISIIGILMCFGFEIFYVSVIKLIMYPKEVLGFGLFHSESRPIIAWEKAIIFFTSLTLFITIPAINFYWTKVRYKKK